MGIQIADDLMDWARILSEGMPKNQTVAQVLVLAADTIRSRTASGALAVELSTLAIAERQAGNEALANLLTEAAAALIQPLG